MTTICQFEEYFYFVCMASDHNLVDYNFCVKNHTLIYVSDDHTFVCVLGDWHMKIVSEYFHCSKDFQTFY